MKGDIGRPGGSAALPCAPQNLFTQHLVDTLLPAFPWQDFNQDLHAFASGSSSTSHANLENLCRKNQQQGIQLRPRSATAKPNAHGPETWKPSALVSASSSEHVSQSKQAPSVFATFEDRALGASASATQILYGQKACASYLPMLHSVQTLAHMRSQEISGLNQHHICTLLPCPQVETPICCPPQPRRSP